MKRPLVITFLLATLLIAGVATLAWATGWDGPDRDRTQTIRIVNGDGSALPPDSTVIVNADNDGRRGFPFGFLFFPFFLLFGFFLISRFAWRGGGRGWHGPTGPGGAPPAWFEEMHTKSHEAEWNRTRSQAPTDAG